MVEQAIADFNVPGLAIAVVAGGEVVYAEGFGHRDLEGELAALGAAPVLLNIGASKPPNRWPPERFGALASGLVLLALAFRDVDLGGVLAAVGSASVSYLLLAVVLGAGIALTGG